MSADRFETVVARQPAPHLQLHSADRKIEFVMDNEQPRQVGDPVSLDERSGGPARLVVERDRHRDRNGLVADSHDFALSVVAPATTKSSPVTTDDFIDDPEPCVVPRLGVLIAGIAETDDQKVGRGTRSFVFAPHHLSAGRKVSPRRRRRRCHPRRTLFRPRQRRWPRTPRNAGLLHGWIG